MYVCMYVCNNNVCISCIIMLIICMYVMYVCMAYVSYVCMYMLIIICMYVWHVYMYVNSMHVIIICSY
jgi:hypothetical protein